MASRDVAFWKEAINDEMDSIMQNNTWKLSDLPLGFKPLGCKWIFKKKMKVDGSVDKFKARLFNFHDSSPVTPMDPTFKLSLNEGVAVSQLEYSRAIGSLMYAMISTRPDIAYAVGKLRRYTSNPGVSHWQAMNRVFRNLKGTMKYGFPLVLEGYSDASWINNKEDHSSISGSTFLLG
ncbi:secreted RxLR effector protein 161-like [Helianthus annuus]|uniref:secreted RxLR effector protein 161-like n=1 Tax=Helianthus annuus TaxID=4232 RepID=UPI0016533BBD|nr:secreted RxLR effector protein 161-like [Helianthus annuus]